MDDADRIAIDIGYEAVSEAEDADPRTRVREDGTVEIDILAPQPCAPDPSTDEEIVVCAEAPGDGQPPAARPDAPDLNEQMSSALNAKVGPAELGSLRNRDGTYSFGARIRF